MLELKITITKIKNTFDMFINIVDTAEVKVSKLKISLDLKNDNNY